jgi:phospholipid/cholesterol/gamma-HCH transport system substrate-binding protein
MKTRTYIRVGILFLATVVIAFWGLNYLKGKNLFSSERSFFAVYGKIGGLAKSCPVTINGFHVGQVRNIQLSERLPGQIEVKFSISFKSVKIPRNSTARIYSIDIMGTKGIALDLSNDPNLCGTDDTLKSSIEGDLRDEVNAQMVPLKLKAESLMASMDSVLIGIQLVFNESNRNNLAESFSNINQTLNNLESASRFLNDYVKDESRVVTSFLNRIDTMSLGLLDKTDEVRNFISNMNRFSDTLSNVPLIAMVASFREVLENLHQLTLRISAGEGTLGKLIITDSVFSAILATNASLNRLIEDVRIHPGKYLRITLTDKSKSVYATNDSELSRALAGEGTSEYYIVLFQSPTLLTPDDPALRRLRSTGYIQVGSLFYYYTYQNMRIESCLRRLDKIRKQNPLAGIYSWVSGKWTRLAL